MIYFDNSATTFFKPQCVIGAVNSTINFLSANAGRSAHSMSIKCARLVNLARQKILDYVNAKDSNAIFTLNCSQALSMAIWGTVKRGDHVITTCYEHNSTLRPLKKLCADMGCTVTIIDKYLDLAKAVERSINRKTALVIVNHVSNVTGYVQDIDGVAKVCKAHSIPFLVDGAQSVGYMPIDMQQLGIDMLAIAPHKGLHAIQGVGVLVVRNVQLRPTIFGGTGTQSFNLDQPDSIPDGFEVGTLPLPAISSIPSAVDWTKSHFLENTDHLKLLSQFLMGELKRINGIKIYSPPSTLNGIIAIDIDGLPSMDACNILSEKYDICTRCGYHCAPLFHKAFHTEKNGLIRISCGVDNTIGDCIKLVEAIATISKS